MKHYTAAVFDLYGTLTDVLTDEEAGETWVTFSAYLTENGMPCTAAEARRVFTSAKTKLELQPSHFQYPEHDILPAFLEVCRAKRPDADEETAWEAGEYFRKCALRRLKLYPHTLKVLCELKKQGIRLFMLTNAQAVYTRQEIRRLGLYELFDAVYISSECGCMKPDPAFFERLISEQGLIREETLMIGNDPFSDAGVAQACGVDCAFLNTDGRQGKMPECEYIYPDGDILHVLELFPVKNGDSRDV